VLVSTEHEGPYAQSLTRHIIPQILYTDGVASQRAGPNVCDDTSECPYGGGQFGVTPSPGFNTVRDIVNGDTFGDSGIVAMVHRRI
jgi:hypothetical protein